MTLILACSWGGKAAIASDSHGADGWTHSEHGSKIRPTAFGAFGFSGSYRWLQIVHHAVKDMQSIKTETHAARVTDAVSRALKRKGWTGKQEKGLPECEGLYAILATKTGHLWHLQPDLAVLPCERIAAAGSGYIAGRAAAQALYEQQVPALEAARRGVEITIGMVLSVKGNVHVLRVK